MAHSPALPDRREAFLEEAFGNHIGILGKTGSGKTTTAKGFAESLIEAGRRICAIDPTGVWWGLRMLSDGRTPAYPVVIFGGLHADLDISESSGARLAEIIAAETFSSIIDTSAMTVGARTRFFTEFAEALHRVNSRPLHLIIDEAHVFAPQGRVPDPQSGRMVHAANNLVSGGRAKGLRIILISQRPAKLHKDSLTQVETLIAMRLIAPQDRAAVEDWIGEWADPKQGREVITSLPSLPRGTGWVWAPELGVLRKMVFPLIATFDSSSTPEHNEPAKSPVDLSAIDIAALRDALAVVEPAAAPKNRRPFTRPAGRGREERLRARLGRRKRAGYRFNNGIPAHAERRERGPTPTQPLHCLRLHRARPDGRRKHRRSVPAKASPNSASCAYSPPVIPPVSRVRNGQRSRG